ncbi:MAG: succinic semialdehyde dehydrogenase [Actinomycetota bacterium]|nr:succinic semialdehyde dehydrogenase [Actinomycetota bacterium]
MTLPASITDDLVSRLTRHVAASTGGTVKTTEIFTGAPLAAIPQSTAEDVARAADAARRAQQQWAATPVRKRMRVFRRFHELVLEHHAEIVDVIQAETGKSRKNAFEEVCDPPMTTSHYLGVAPRLLRPKRRKGVVPFAVTSTEIRRPKGVVGFISPWNGPFCLGLSDAIPALMAGNGVVLKPDSQTALSPLYGVELLYRAGLPRGLFQVVVGDGPVVGPAVVDNTDYVMFTGSSRTGADVAARAGGRLAGCSLELGGKNPLVMLDDADLDLAVKGTVENAFMAAGQICMHIERVYVPEAMFDTFRDRMVEATEAVTLGASYEFGPDVGCLINQRQLDTVAAHVEDARAKGAQVLTGGRSRPDLGPTFYEPTVLTGVTRDMTCFAEETFGPVVALYPYRDVDHAVAMANDTEFGLNASVYGGDLKKAAKVAERIRAGTVNVNDGMAAAYSSIDTPAGGVGDSGVGTRHGDDGLLKYTDVQHVAVQRKQVLGPPEGMPYAKHAGITIKSLRIMRKTGIR